MSALAAVLVAAWIVLVASFAVALTEPLNAQRRALARHREQIAQDAIRRFDRPREDNR